MSDSNQNEWHRLFSAALDDTLTAPEKTQLAELLKSNAEARQLWFLYHDNECGLAELKPRTVVRTEPRTPSRTTWLPWSPLTAAAAGLVFGLFSASMVWGYVGNYTGKAITLFEDRFEAGSAPLVAGMPAVAGRWSGDYSEIVGEFGGVKPAQGGKMLRFLRADYEGKPVRDGWVADLFRIVDLRGDELGVARGDVSVMIEARFAALPQDQLGRMSCGVTIYALDEMPPVGERDDAFLRRATSIESGESSDAGPHILATSARSETGESWQTVRSELRLPGTTRYAMIHLRAHLNGSHRAEVPKPVAFAGLFVDDIRMTLTHRRPLP